MDTAGDLRWFGALKALLDAAHLLTPDRLADVVDDAARPLGLRMTLWLVDYEQSSLRALPRRGRPARDPRPVDGSLAGRAFMSVVSLRAEDGRWWVPVVDGTDRLGVMEIRPANRVDPADRVFVTRC